MVNQLLFGESYEVLTEKNGFLQVTTQYDEYTGWIDRALHREVSASGYQRLCQEPVTVLDALLMSVERRGAPPQLVIAGSTLPGYNKKKNILEFDGEVFHIRWTFGSFGIKGTSSLLKTTGHFLNTPYLWGGRSVFGCDCSGFVQVVYKIHGIRLKRDSFQQAEQGEPVTSLKEARLGDLAFFSGETGRVYHVGMILSPGEIIHSSGYVHIDRLDEQGIFNLVNQEYSHRSFTIRRVADLEKSN
jgi:hypothetical protein